MDATSTAARDETTRDYAAPRDLSASPPQGREQDRDRGGPP